MKRPKFDSITTEDEALELVENLPSINNPNTKNTIEFVIDEDGDKHLFKYEINDEGDARYLPIKWYSANTTNSHNLAATCSNCLFANLDVLTSWEGGDTDITYDDMCVLRGDLNFELTECGTDSSHTCAKLGYWAFDENRLIQKPPATTTTTAKSQGNTTMMKSTNSLVRTMLSRMFREADGVVWDMMNGGRLGIKTASGIATLQMDPDGEAEININPLDQFGVPVPAFAQNTPMDQVAVGDLIFFGATGDRPGWIIEIKTTSTNNRTFVLLKTDGQRATWKPPKTAMFGVDTGVMVLRNMGSMVGGDAGVQNMQSMFLPLMMMQGEDSSGGKLKDMLMMSMFMQQQQGANQQNPLAMLAMMQMMK